jgi:VWFA-related protein
LTLFAGFLGAQQIGENTPAKNADGVLFTSETQLVIETVSVTDKDGVPIENLTAEDFAVTEDGVPQTIRFFEFQKLPSEAAGPPAEVSAEQIQIYEKLGRTRMASEASGEGDYQNRRLLVLYFDMTAMQPAEQARSLGAAVEFVRGQMTSADLLAILRYAGGSVDVLQDFTGDRNRLLSILQTMIVGEGQGFGESIDDASTADTSAAFGQDNSEFNVFNTDRQLAALQTAADMLARIREKKSLIYFGGGLRLSGMNNQAQLRATLNAAIRAGVSFWPVDARGLVAQAPLGDASVGSPGNAGVYSGAAAMAVGANFQRSQDTLYALAADTGGKALFDNNDLSRGIVQAQQAISSYYILGYYTTKAAKDGSFRRVEITLNPPASAKLDYRRGYFAEKEFSQFTEADKERQLEEALMLQDPVTDLPIAMELNHFQLNRAEYFVPLSVKIPGSELALAKRGGAVRTTIDFIGEVKTKRGSTMTNVRDKVELKLSDATAEELGRRPIVYETGFTLLPGEYIVKFLARDAETGRIGTYQTSFTVPNLNLEQKSIPLSSVVLSSQLVSATDTLFDAAKERSAIEAVNPLVSGGQKMIPSVTRVFRHGHVMHLYAEAYQQRAEGERPLIALVGLYRGQEKAFETGPIEFSHRREGRLQTLPLRFEVPLAEVEPGTYECQLTVLDPVGGKASFWRGPVALVE